MSSDVNRMLNQTTYGSQNLKNSSSESFGSWFWGVVKGALITAAGVVFKSLFGKIFGK